MRRRLERGLVRAHAAREMGVTREALTAWESGRTPPSEFWPRIVSFLGYDPSPKAETLGQRLAAARRSLGLTVKALAAEAGCDREAIGNWERNRSRPTGLHAKRLAICLASAEPTDPAILSELSILAELPSWPTYNLLMETLKHVKSQPD